MSSPDDDDPLARYRDKRSAGATPEPIGARPAGTRASAGVFVVHEHHATRTHWDLRLEIDGVLVSWAVPHGPTMDPDVKRLAVKVEAHPLEYCDFEAVIPEGNYGAGPMVVWDRGRFMPEIDPREGLRGGEIKFSLQGYKLRGAFTLVKTGGRGPKGSPSARGGDDWLLIKKRDAWTEAAAAAGPLPSNSVLSGLTAEELAAGAPRIAAWRAALAALGAPKKTINPVGFAPMLHDFIATERHLVWFLAPAAVHVPRMLLGLGDFAQLFRWRPELGTEIIVMPIDAPGDVVRFTVDAFYQWHFANAFERGGEVVVDYVRYPNFDSFGALAQGGGPSGLDEGRLHRAVIDVGARRLRSEAVLDVGVEFPRIHPAREGQAHSVTWMADAGLGGVVAHHGDGRLERWRCGAHEVVAEPVFVPAPDATDEQAGWVLTLVYDGRADASYLAVLDATRLEDGPVARAWFDHPVPITFHGSWLPA